MTAAGARALAAQFGKPHDGFGQVVCGRQLQGVHARAGQRAVQGFFALGGDGGKAVAEGRVVGVDQQVFAGFGVTQGDQAQVGQVLL